MTPTEAHDTIDRLVADLARATGRSENLIRVSYGLDLVDVDAAPGAAA